MEFEEAWFYFAVKLGIEPHWFWGTRTARWDCGDGWECFFEKDPRAMNLGPLIEVYRSNRLVKVRATKCKKCGHFHSSASGCGHISYPFKEYPWFIYSCHCTDLESWDFMEQGKEA